MKLPERTSGGAWAAAVTDIFLTPVVNGSTLGPAIDRRLYPRWYGYGSHVAGFPDEVDDHPMVLALLNLANLQRNDFRSTQPTAKEKRDDGAIAFLPKRVRGGSREEHFAFSGAQPVANAPTEVRHALDTADACDQFWAQQAGIGCLIRQPPHGSESDVDG